MVGRCACTLGAFTISATVGVFGLHEHWVGNLVWTAAVSEAVALATGLVGLGSAAAGTRRPVPARVTSARLE